MNFEDLAFLFACDNRNRGIIRMNFDEAACLWRCVKVTGGPILEIGRAHGGSTALLLAASGPARHVTSIDIAPRHRPEAESFFAAPENASRLTLEVADSATCQTVPCGLLFIDGDHSYEGVKADVVRHWGNLQPFDGFDALAVFHDAVPNDGLQYAGEINHCPGVTQLCGELLACGCATRVASAGSVLVLRKLAELPGTYT